MHTVNLEELDGGMIVRLPSDVVEQLHLVAGGQMTLEAEGGHLRLHRRRTSRYTLEELLSQCDFSLPISKEEQEWMDMPSVGREIVEP